MNIEKEYFVDSSFPDPVPDRCLELRRLRDATYHMELTVWTHEENEKTFQYNTSYSFISYSNWDWYSGIINIDQSIEFIDMDSKPH